MMSKQSELLAWIDNEAFQIADGLREGLMTVEDATVYLDCVRRKIAAQRDADDADEDSPSPADSEGELLYDFKKEDDPSKRRPFRMLLVDLETGEIAESSHRLSKREAISLWRSWKTHKENAVCIFWPTFAKGVLEYRREINRESLRGVWMSSQST